MMMMIMMECSSCAHMLRFFFYGVRWRHSGATNSEPCFCYPSVRRYSAVGFVCLCLLYCSSVARRLIGLYRLTFVVWLTITVPASWAARSLTILHGSVLTRSGDVRHFSTKRGSWDITGYNLVQQEAQLMLTTGSTRLAVSRGQHTWYHFRSIATFR